MKTYKTIVGYPSEKEAEEWENDLNQIAAHENSQKD
jgi:hypothetical protein